LRVPTTAGTYYDGGGLSLPVEPVGYERRYKRMDVKLYIGNLSYSTTGDDLRDLFAQAGTVASSTVVTHRDTGRSRGFGFVEMTNQVEAEKAITMFNNYLLDNREIVVNIARPREDRGDRRRGGRRRF